MSGRSTSPRAAWAVAALITSAAAPAFGQTAQSPSVADREALVASAERAAADAERAAAEARHAVAAADEAARAARLAATAARAALGGSPAPPAAGSGKSTVTVASAPTSDARENLPVRRPDANGSMRTTAIATDEGQAGRSAKTAIASSVANGPNESFLKSAGAPDLQFIASSKDKVASLSWTVDISGPSRPNMLSADQFTLTASGKFDGEADTGIIGLDGFPNGTEVKLKYIHFGGRTALTGIERSPVAVARANCERERGGPTGCDPYAEPGVGAFMTRWNPQGYGALLDEVLPGPVWFAGVEFAGNQVSYKYLDRTAFKVGKESRFGYGGSVFGGALMNRGLTALTAGYTWRRQFNEADPITLCQPVAGGPQTQCITSADGRPSRDSQSLVSLELRHAFPVATGQFSTFAIAPSLTYDLDEGAYGVELPVYVAGDGTGKLRGGFKGGYVNRRDGRGGREDTFELGLFVGVPFSLLRQ